LNILMVGTKKLNKYTEIKSSFKIKIKNDLIPVYNNGNKILKFVHISKYTCTSCVADKC